MSEERRADLFDEGRLRRALRLEPSEIPARLDPNAFALLARPRFAAATLASASLAGLAGALLVAAAFVGIGAIAPALVSETLASTIAFLASAAVPIDSPMGPGLSARKSRASIHSIWDPLLGVSKPSFRR